MDTNKVREILMAIPDTVISNMPYVIEWFDSHHHISNEDWNEMMKDWKELSKNHPDDKIGDLKI